MGTKNNIAFIVEGIAREPQIIKNLERGYLGDCNVKIFTLPAGQNIYMLWNQMKLDDFETDLIELLRESNEALKEDLKGLSREDFSEVYLFFDYDGQQKNLPKAVDADAEDILLQMLQSFDNETENGKLYISYPMVEALRDYMPDVCGKKENCFWDKEDDSVMGYRRISAERSAAPRFGEFGIRDWKEAINVFAMRVSCLMGEEEKILSYQEYREEGSPKSIFAAQVPHIREGRVFILSAFPEFLLDYFPEKFWNSCLVHTELQKIGLCNGCR